MIQQANSENFESLVQDGFVIVDFYGTTCVPCKLFARILEDVGVMQPQQVKDVIARYMYD